MSPSASGSPGADRGATDSAPSPTVSAPWWHKSLSLRLALFALRRYRGYSRYALVAVFTPVFVLCVLAGVPWLAGKSAESTARLEAGSGVAAFEYTPATNSRNNQLPLSVQEAARAAHAQGITVTPVHEVRWPWQDHHVDVLLTTPNPALGPKAELVNGRWPTTFSEVLVTPAGHAAGLPHDGDVSIDVGGTMRVFTVVGTATGYANYAAADLITVFADAPTTVPGSQQKLLVLTELPSSVPTFRKWLYNVSLTPAWTHLYQGDQPTLVHNVIMESTYRAKASTTSADFRFSLQWLYQASFGSAGIVVLAILLGLLVVPSFLMSAQRSRWMLTVLAMNGARRNTLAAVTMWQGLLIGLTGVAAGVAAALVSMVAVREVGPRLNPTWVFPAWAVPVADITVISTCTLVAVVGAALWPAWNVAATKLTRSVTQAAEKPVHIGWLLLGIGVAISGFIWMVLAVFGGSQRFIAWGAVLYLIGILLTVPHVLAGLSALLKQLPFWARFAVRDAARSKSRTAPMVGAILAATALLTMASFTMSTFQNTAAAQKGSVGFEGKVIVWPQETLGDRSDFVTQATKRLENNPSFAAPQALSAVGVPWRAAWPTPARSHNNSADVPLILSEPAQVHFFANTGCANAEQISIWLNNEQPASCTIIGEAQPVAQGKDGVLVVTKQWLTTNLSSLPPATLQRVLDGGLLVDYRKSGDPRPYQIFSGTLQTATTSTGDHHVQFTPAGAPQPIPTVLADYGHRLGLPPGFSALITDTTAAKLSLPTSPVAVSVTSTQSDLSPEIAVTRSLSDLNTVVVHLPAAASWQYEPVVWAEFDWFFIALGVLLVAVSCLTVLLNTRQLQSQIEVLHAMGAHAGVRRTLAVAQAVGLSVIGMTLGFVVGTAPSVAIATALFRRGDVMEQWSFTGPWLSFAVLFVVVPVVVSIVTMAATRRGDLLVRRQT